ncbi:hypothetical protein C8Q72DRAFT_807308 [Fomitopsis betulina]|nr:hypothetical protein C8Q72DRAFT_807308 [Fomitopsis betulina]
MCPACQVARRVFCRTASNTVSVLTLARRPLASHPTVGVRLASTASTRNSRLRNQPRAPAVDSPQQLSDDDIESRLSAAASGHGKWHAIRLYEKFKQSGYKASQWTFLAFLRDSFDANLLQFYEKALDRKATSAVWAKLVHNAYVKSNNAAVLSLYDTALKSGVRPTNALIHPVIRVLCSGSLRPPTEASIDKALQLYQEYVMANQRLGAASEVSVASETQDSAKGSLSNSESTTPDTAIYNTLLRALASSSDIKKYFPIALSLLEDLHVHKVDMDPMTTTALIVLLMRTSPTYEEAYRAYRSVYQSDDGNSRLDAEGYAVVLHTFCNRDMRAAGYPVSTKVYTVILQRLAVLATRARGTVNPEDRQAELLPLAAQIRRVHDALRLDSITPDTALWNQLMDTYQRAQCFSDALAVWELLYHSSRHDNVSVSVILDACAYANAYGIATKIWDDLFTTQFPLNLHNWNTWLECLCRMGQLEEAVKALCLEMGSGKGPHAVKPDANCARLVLSFASRRNEEEVVLKRIKQYLPHIWQKL